jgi:hypothetical protein
MLAVNILMLVSGVACLVTGNLLMNWLNGGSFALLVWSLGFTEVIIFVIIKALKPETMSRLTINDDVAEQHRPPDARSDHNRW